MPCVWDMSHLFPSPCPVWVMLGSAPSRGTGGKGHDNDVIARTVSALAATLASPRLGSFSLLTPFLEAGRESQANTVLWAVALPPARCSWCLPSPSSTQLLPSLSPGECSVAEVKSVSLYIDSWRFTRLTLCPDDTTTSETTPSFHIRSLFASGSFSDLFFVACTSFGSVCDVALFFFVNTATNSSSVFPCLQLKDTVINDTLQLRQLRIHSSGFKDCSTTRIWQCVLERDPFS